MKRHFLWAALTLSLASIVGLAVAVGPCWSATETHDVLVVLPADVTSGSDADQVNFTTRNKARVLFDLLDQAGTDYTVIKCATTKVKTEQLRTGTITLSGGPSITFRSYILASLRGFSAYSGASAGRLRPDSLLRASRGGCTTPGLWLIDNGGEGGLSGGGGGNSAWLDSTSFRGPMLTSPSYFNIIENATGTLAPWFGNSYVSGYRHNTEVAGGSRVLLSLYCSQQNTVYHANQSSGPRNAFNVDSAAYALPGAGVDTAIVATRLWNIATLPNARPMVFCKWAGVGWNTDSLGGGGYYAGINNDTEGDVTVLLYGLAAFDSVTARYSSDGRGYIFKNMKRPFRLAPIVYGLGTRNLRRFSRGILPSDTSVAYATMDSIRVMGIKVTYAVDPESSLVYPRDLVVAKQNGAARFTPQSWATFGPTGLDSVNRGRTLIGGNWLAAFPTDVWGHFRNRTFWGQHRDSSTYYDTDPDSSITQGLVQQRKLLAAIVGSQRLSSCAVAPFDDYSPLTMVHGGARAGDADSIVFACQKAGYTHLLSEVFYRTGDPEYHVSGAIAETNPWGWFFRQGPRYNSLTGKRFMIVGKNRQPLMQGERQAIMWADSATGGVYTTFAVPRAIQGALLRSPMVDLDQHAQPNNAIWTNPVADANWYTDGWIGTRIDPEEWSGHLPQRASALALSFASISGNPSSPARSGYWTLKWINNAMRNINAAAGKALFVWAYPEEIDR